MSWLVAFFDCAEKLGAGTAKSGAARMSEKLGAGVAKKGYSKTKWARHPF